jgi:hypothetical protein
MILGIVRSQFIAHDNWRIRAGLSIRRALSFSGILVAIAKSGLRIAETYRAGGLVRGPRTDIASRQSLIARDARGLVATRGLDKMMVSQGLV